MSCLSHLTHLLHTSKALLFCCSCKHAWMATGLPPIYHNSSSNSSNMYWHINYPNVSGRRTGGGDDIYCPRCGHDFDACHPPWLNRAGRCLVFWTDVEVGCWACGGWSVLSAWEGTQSEGGVEGGGGEGAGEIADFQVDCKCGYPLRNGGFVLRRAWGARKRLMEALMRKKLDWQRLAGDVEFPAAVQSRRVFLRSS